MLPTFQRRKIQRSFDANIPWNNQDRHVNPEATRRYATPMSGSTMKSTSQRKILFFAITKREECHHSAIIATTDIVPLVQERLS